MGYTLSAIQHRRFAFRPFGGNINWMDPTGGRPPFSVIESGPIGIRAIFRSRIYPAISEGVVSHRRV
jgi:hypothetical protein